MNAITFVVALVAAAFALHYSGHQGVVTKTVSRMIHGKPGCFPIAKIEDVKLHYFAGRGRGEPMRLLMNDWNISYSETGYTRETWPQAKQQGMKSGLYMFGQAPAIETSDGVKLVQSHVILRYLGRSVGLDCECDEFDYCAIVAAGVEDLGKQLSKIIYDPNFSVAMRDEYLKSTLPTWLSHFEKLIPESSNSKQSLPYIINGHLTWVDYLLVAALDSNVEFGRLILPGDAADHGKNDVLKNFPKLSHYYQLIFNRPAITDYLKSDKRYPYKIPYMPKE